MMLAARRLPFLCCRCPVGATALKCFTDNVHAGGQDIRKVPNAGILGADTEREERVVQMLRAQLRHGPVNVGDLKGFLAEPHKAGHPEDLMVVADVEALVARHTNTFVYDVTTKRVGLRDLVGAQGVDTVSRKDERVSRGRPAVPGGGPQSERGQPVVEAVVSQANPQPQHKDTVHSGTVAKMSDVVDQAADRIKNKQEEAEERVVQRLTAKLQDGPVIVPVLKAFLGNPVSGGGPEDLRVVKDWEAFVGRHTDTFLYDAATRMLGLHARSDDRSPIHSGNEVIDEAAEARVVQRLKAKLQAGPVYLYTLRNFLQDPRKGGGPADLRVVKNWKEFVRRHTETFIYDAPSKMLRLRDLSVKIDPHVEARVVERLMPKLQSGPVKVGYLKGFLSEPRQGGGPEHQWVVADWEAFVARHADTLVYDAATQTLCLQASVGDPMADSRLGFRNHPTGQGIDAFAEARVVQRLTAALKSGPVKVNQLKSFLGDPFQNGRPEDVRVVKDWTAFVGRHVSTFVYDAASGQLGLLAPTPLVSSLSGKAGSMTTAIGNAIATVTAHTNAEAKAPAVGGREATDPTVLP